MEINKVINGFWEGDRLTNIQKLCIRSFQDNGHDFHLYVKGQTEGIPAGTIVHDVREILPPIIPPFTAPNFFSDYFRAKLIYEVGGYYSDVDEICLKPFNFTEPYVFVSEVWQLDPSKFVNNGCIFKAPPKCEFLADIIRTIESMDVQHPTSWVCMGPELFTKMIPKYNLGQYVKEPAVFDPLRPERLGDFVSGGQTWDLSQAYATHLRTSYWSGARFQPNATYESDSLFEQLKRKHGV